MDFKIFVVEDNEYMFEELKEVLNSFGYLNIDTAQSGEDALNKLKTFNADLILMDVVLKGKQNGIETAKEVQKFSDVPIMFMTSLTDDEVIEEILSTDGFIYLSKPYRIPELKANIAMVYNRYLKEKDLKEKNQKNRAEVEKLKHQLEDIGFDEKVIVELNDNYSYNLEKEELFLNNKVISLTTKEKKFINFLIKNSNSILTYEQIKDIIWEEYVPDSTVRSLVRRVREKLSIIENVSGVGYKLIK